MPKHTDTLSCFLLTVWPHNCVELWNNIATVEAISVRRCCEASDDCSNVYTSRYSVAIYLLDA